MFAEILKVAIYLSPLNHEWKQELCLARNYIHRRVPFASNIPRRSKINIEQSADFVTFEDADATYYADACMPLTDAAALGELTLSALARGHYPGDRFPEECLPGVRTVGSWDTSTAQDWGLDWHRNEGIEITYLARGTVGFSVDEESWNLQAGQVTVTRPWQRHRVGHPNIGPSRLHWIILDVGVRRPNQTWDWPEWIALSPIDVNRLTVLLQQNEHAVWGAGDALAETFDTIGRLTSRKDAHTAESELRIAISSLLLELLKTVERYDPHLDETLTAPRRGVAIFLEDLDARLDRKWTVSRMATACGMGRTQFADHCQDLHNMAPMEYLNARRLLRASEMLLHTTTSVTAIADSCGFITPQYFATRFRQRYGESPLLFRRNAILESGTP